MAIKQGLSACSKYRKISSSVVAGEIPLHTVTRLGDVLLGRVPGRSSGEEITLFDALGLAVEDVACVKYLCGGSRS